jgi:hypothetical protein
MLLLSGQFTVFTADSSMPKIFGMDGILTGGDALPGFTLAVKGIVASK